MLDIKKAAESLGIKLLGVNANLQELEQLPGPKILHLKNPEHFIAVSFISPRWVQIVGRWGAYTYPREIIEKRFTGYALILNPQEFQYEGGPRLQIEEFHHDFGQWEKGREMVHSFVIHNNGDKDLLIFSQSDCCNAIEVSIQKNVVKPGDTAEITLRHIPLSPGKIMVSSKLLTNDPSHPILFLTMGGWIKFEVSVWPESLEIKGAKGENIFGNLRITLPPDAQIKEVVSENGLLKLELREMKAKSNEQAEENGSEGDSERPRFFHLRAICEAKKVPGSYKDILRIYTTSEAHPLILVPVKITIQNEIKIDPPNIFFGFVKQGQIVSQRVSLLSHSGKSFVIEGVRTSHPFLKVDIAVEVHTNLEGEETLQLPIYAHIIRR